MIEVKIPEDNDSVFENIRVRGYANMKHTVRHVRSEVLRWLESRPHEYQRGFGIRLFRFENPDDAVLFKLTFGGM